MRETSIQVFHQIEAEGLLSKMRFMVYSIVVNKGPLTIAEASKYVPLIDSRSISPRFAELERVGCIAAIGRKICSVTGREVILWETTNKLPVKLEKPERHKCKTCDGKGYTEETQAKLF